MEAIEDSTHPLSSVRDKQRTSRRTGAGRLGCAMVLFCQLASSRVEGFASSALPGVGRGALRMPRRLATPLAPRERCPAQRALCGVRRTLDAGAAPVGGDCWRHAAFPASRLGAGGALEGAQGGPNSTVTLTPDGVKTKKHMNAYRKIFHAVNGVLLACAYELFLTRKQAIVVFGISFIVLTLIEVLRLRYARSAVSQLLFGKFRAIARDYETNQLSGMVYYMAGITISVAAFPKRVAVLSILYLALGDPFASTMGIKYGKLGPRFSNGKSLIGSVGGFAICAVTTGLYFAPSLQVSVTLGLVSLLGGIAAAIPETLCGRITDGKGGPLDVDDNLAVPIGSGLLLLVLLRAFFPSVI